MSHPGTVACTGTGGSGSGGGKGGLGVGPPVSVEGSVGGGRAVAVFVAGLCADQSQGGLCLWSQREASGKGLAAVQGKGDWSGLGDCSAEVGEAPWSNMAPGAGGLGGTEPGDGHSDWCEVRGI